VRLVLVEVEPADETPVVVTIMGRYAPRDERTREVDAVDLAVLVPGVAVLEVVRLPGVCRQNDEHVRGAETARPQDERCVPESLAGRDDLGVIQAARPVADLQPERATRPLDSQIGVDGLSVEQPAVPSAGAVETHAQAG